MFLQVDSHAFCPVQVGCLWLLVGMYLRKVEEVKVRSELTDRNATSDKLSLDLVDALFTLAMAW